MLKGFINRTYTKIYFVGPGKKVISVFILFVMFGILSIMSMSYEDSISRKMRRLGYKGLRVMGFWDPTVSEYQDNVGTDNVAYDYNLDGTVTGEDYPLLISDIESDSLAESSITPDEPEYQTDGTTESTASSDSTAGQNEAALPSLRGFGAGGFNGSVNVDYPINLPPGPGGLNPNLSLNYSSASVDDLLSGIPTKWRNDQSHSYQQQASVVGLGWNLSGFGYISRDTNATLNDPSDDKFILNFSEGAANLVRESCDESLGCDVYSKWRTVPNIMVNAERFGRCYNYNYGEGSMQLCRYHWEITTGDGTKYTFGSSYQTTGWDDNQNLDPDAKYITGSNVEWYPLYDSSTNSGYRAWRYYGNSDKGYHALTYKWPLTKVSTVFEEMTYKYEFEFAKDKTDYVRAIYPSSIFYGNHQVQLERENRLDYLTHSGDDSTPEQPYRATQRMNKIVIKTKDKNSEYRTRKAYTLSYDYGFRDENGNGALDDSERVSGKAIHSLLKELIMWNEDPISVSGAEKMPPTTFSYGENCENFVGGCPLKSYTDDEGTGQARTPNDFFLVSSENGYNGKIEFEYFQNGSGGNALEIKYCKNDEYGGQKECQVGHKNNIQRHRVAAKIEHDGMGDTVRTEYKYTTDQGLGYVEGFGTAWFQGQNCCNADMEGGCIEGKPSGCVCPGDSTTCVTAHGWDCAQGESCGWKSDSGLCCPDDYPKEYSYQCETPWNGNSYICPGTSSNPNVTCYSNCKYQYEPFAGYEFLGYPSVETLVYEKNSNNDVIARNRSYFYQAMESSDSTCFKPSPIKGLSYKTETFDTDTNQLAGVTETKYRVRIGSMFGPWDGADAGDELNSKCSSYNLRTTVTSVFTPETVQRVYVGGNQALCTKTTTDYRNFWEEDGVLKYDYDPYLQPHVVVDWGKVSCNTLEDVDDGTPPKWSFTDYNAANQAKWINPLPKESWVSDSENGSKYNHTRTYYDYHRGLQDAADYGRVTLSQVLIDGQVYAETSTQYDDQYKYLPRQTTDPLGRTTSTEYDNFHHMYPTKVTNAIGQTVETEYDFTTSLAEHPNYNGIYGVPIRIKDPNGSITQMVYDNWGRLVETYLPGKSPSSGSGDMPSTYIKYYYYNENDVSGECNDSSYCLEGLGNELGQGVGPKMMTRRGVRYEDGGSSDIGSVSESFTYYNALGQAVQNRNTWYDGSYSSAGIPVDGQGLVDILSSSKFNALGQAYVSSMSYTAAPFGWRNSTFYDTRDIEADNGIQVIKNEFDGLNRPVRVVYPDGGVETTQYEKDGDPLKVASLGRNCNDSDPGSKCVEIVEKVNAFGQNAEILELYYDDEQQENKTIKTEYKYHPVLGMVTDVVDTKGTTISHIKFDKLGRKVSMWDIDMSAPRGDSFPDSWTYEYDILGNLIKQNNPLNQAVELSYDSLDRLKSKKVNGNTLLENTYDNCTNGIGRICKTISYDIENNPGEKVSEVSFVYDSRGQTTEMAKKILNMPNSSINDKTFVTRYEYDEGGRVTKTVYPEESGIDLNAETLSVDFDRGNVIGISTDKEIGNYVSGAKYNKNGQLVYFENPNGIVTSYEYSDLSMRLSSLQVEGGQLADNERMLLSYSYDSVGNITRISDNARSSGDSFWLDQAFTYDALNRLLGASGAYEATYSYDEIDNIEYKEEGDSNVSLEYEYSDGSGYHRPIGGRIDGSSVDFEYDTIGNMVEDYRNYYTYDDDNRLLLVTPKSQEELSIINSSIEKTCTQTCIDKGYSVCESVGLNETADDGTFWSQGGDFGGVCAVGTGAGCDRMMSWAGGLSCEGKGAEWTLCNCGVEQPAPVCDPILAPQNLIPYGEQQCGLSQITLSWDPVIDAVKYQLRVDDQTNPWNDPDDPGYAGSNEGDYVVEVSGTSYSINIVEGHYYNWWVYAVNECGDWSESSSIPSDQYLVSNACAPTDTCIGTYSGKCVPEDYDCTPDTSYGIVDCAFGEVCVEGTAECSAPPITEPTYEVVFSEFNKSCNQTCFDQGYDRCESVGTSSDANDSQMHQSTTSWFFSRCTKVSAGCDTVFSQQSGKVCSDREPEWTQCNCVLEADVPPEEPPEEPDTCIGTYSGKCVPEDYDCTPDTSYGIVDCAFGEVCVEGTAECTVPSETCTGTYSGKCVPDTYECTPDTTYGVLDCLEGEICVQGDAQCLVPVEPPSGEYTIIQSELGKSCNTTCTDSGYLSCLSVGTNSDADNSLKSSSLSGFFGSFCRELSASCSSVLSNQNGAVCSNIQTEWTNCKCENPVASLPETCSETYGGTCVPTNYECDSDQNYGKLDCSDSEVCVDPEVSCTPPTELSECEQSYNGKCIPNDYVCTGWFENFGQVDCGSTEKCVNQDAACSVPQDPPAVSCVPDPVEPSDWDEINTVDIRFEWSNCHSNGDADAYQIIIQGPEDYEYFSNALDADTSETFDGEEIGLNYNQDYTWRVRSCGDTGCEEFGAWSIEYSFTWTPPRGYTCDSEDWVCSESLNCYLEDGKESCITDCTRCDGQHKECVETTTDPIVSPRGRVIKPGVTINECKLVEGEESDKCSSNDQCSTDDPVLGVQSLGQGEVRFYYDGSGQRISKIVGGGDVTYYISPILEVVYYPDGTVNWRKNYYFGGKLVAVREYLDQEAADQDLGISGDEQSLFGSY